MHHEDGIEVYLKPLGENFATTKLREIPIEQDQSEPRHKRCVVYKTAASFAVVLRFSDDFNMGAASALSAGIGMGGDDSKLRVRYWNIPRSMRDLGRSTFTKNSKDCPTYSFTTSLPNSETNVFPYDLHPIPGAFTVYLRKGNTAWHTAPKSLYGSEDPTQRRKKSNRKFRPLEGSQGECYTFEFRPVSYDVYEQTQARRSMQITPALSDRFDCATDDDYTTAGRIRKKRVQHFSNEWKKRRAENSRFGAAEVTRMMRELLSSLPAEMRLPAVRTSQGEDVTPGLVTPTVPLSSSAGGRKKPALPICDCPAAHERASKAGTTAKAPARDGDLHGSEAPRKKDLSSSDNIDREALKEGAPSVDKDRETNEGETPAKTCGTCKKFKSPPRGKKISYRRSQGKHMYVRQDAPDEDAPMKSSVARSLPDIDQDDEELSPVSDSTTAERQIAVQGEDETLTPLAEPIAKDIAEPTNEAQVEAVATQGQEEEPEPVSPEVGWHAQDETMRQQNEISKRCADSQIIERPAKQQRIDVDLTEEDDHELLAVKKEAHETKPSTARDESQDEEDRLQAELEDLEMQQEALNIRRRRTEVRRKLKMLQGSKSAGSNVKIENAIKIED